jgi:hypothetical protein
VKCVPGGCRCWYRRNLPLYPLISVYPTPTANAFQAPHPQRHPTVFTSDQSKVRLFGVWHREGLWVFFGRSYGLLLTSQAHEQFQESAAQTKYVRKNRQTRKAAAEEDPKALAHLEEPIPDTCPVASRTTKPSPAHQSARRCRSISR